MIHTPSITKHVIGARFLTYEKRTIWMWVLYKNIDNVYLNPIKIVRTYIEFSKHILKLFILSNINRFKVKILIFYLVKCISN